MIRWKENAGRGECILTDKEKSIFDLKKFLTLFFLHFSGWSPDEIRNETVQCKKKKKKLFDLKVDKWKN